MKEFDKVKESLQADLQWYTSMKKSVQTHINKIDALRRKAVSKGNDDTALEHTNQLVQLRKDYAYIGGCEDGVRHALRTIAHYEESIDSIRDDEEEIL